MPFSRRSLSSPFTTLFLSSAPRITSVSWLMASKWPLKIEQMTTTDIPFSGRVHYTPLITLKRGEVMK